MRVVDGTADRGTLVDWPMLERCNRPVARAEGGPESSNEARKLLILLGNQALEVQHVPSGNHEHVTRDQSPD